MALTHSLSLFSDLNSWITLARSIHAHTPSLLLFLRLSHFNSVSRLYNKGQSFILDSYPPHTHCIPYSRHRNSPPTKHSLSFMYLFFFLFHLVVQCICLLLNLRHHLSTLHPPSQRILITSLPACPFLSPFRPLLAAHNPSSPFLFFCSPAVTFDLDSLCKTFSFLAHRSRYHALLFRLFLRIHIVILVNVTMASLNFLVSPCRFAHLTHLCWIETIVRKRCIT